MTKTSTQTVLLPTILLKDTLIHLPGVTFNLSLSFKETFSLLNLFLSDSKLLSPKIKKSLQILKSKINVSNDSDIKKLSNLTNDAKSGIELIDSLSLNSEKQPVIACLPIDKNNKLCSKVSIISKVTNVQILPDYCIIGLKGELKGYIYGDVKLSNDDLDDLKYSKYLYFGEIWYEFSKNIQIENSKDLLEISENILNGIQVNLSLIEDFLNDYSALESSNFKDLLYKLNPLAELLNIQLSDSTTSSNLLKLKNLIKIVEKNQFNQILTICDIYVSIFPFSFNQCVHYLQLKDPKDQLEATMELINFVSKIFNDYLNLNYVLDSWNRLGKLQNGKSLQSKFIINHFNSLKELLDLTSHNLKARGNNNNKNKFIYNNRKDQNKTRNNVIDNKGDEEDDDDLANITKFISNIHNYDISEDGKNLLIKDYRRLKKMQKSSSEYQQLRNYIEILMDIPWSKISADEIPKDNNNVEHKESIDVDILKAKTILNNDHFGMESAKERILEHIAILKLTENGKILGTAKSPILLLNGPPGVGKTSIAKSIANCLNCEFQRISLGGINDFADLKGHRRTYIGAIPGLVIQALRRAKTMNPIILLDEIDKIGMANNKGNPEAALLEILDPEQNMNFTDHYVGFPVDLSKVIFIATSNDKWDISEPLRDRMEIIDLDGYNCKEKVKIASQFILPRQLKRNGLKLDQVKIDDDVLKSIAVSYTHEAGIRNFERLISKICRKKAIEILKISNQNDYNAIVSEKDLIKYLGVPHSFGNEEKFSSGDSIIQENFGIVNGLSYNSDGSGSLLKFEMVGLPGSKRISCTGRLGEVLLESCEIAETLVENLIHKYLFLDYDEKELLDRLNDTSVHMHVPEGAVKKDGPSAGITMTLCYLSLIIKRPVPKNIAMTGEITLSAKILPIGGLKEKLLGASLTGQITKVLAPRLNRKDLITAYIDSIPDRDEANLILTKLVLEEEDCLSNKQKRNKFSNEVELWIREEYGVDIKYVDDFIDVINEVWDHSISLIRKEVKAHL